MFSCKEEEKVPNYVMPEDQFVEVLTEFQVAEALVRLGHHRKNDSIYLNDSIYSSVFRKLNISSELFDSNFTYYSERPKQFEKVYEQVITNLSERSAQLLKKEEILKKERKQKKKKKKKAKSKKEK